MSNGVLKNFLSPKLRELKEKGLYNEIDVLDGANGPEIFINGRKLINLSSNNYLGLATREDIKQAEIMLDRLKNDFSLLSFNRDFWFKNMNNFRIDDDYTKWDYEYSWRI